MRIFGAVLLAASLLATNAVAATALSAGKPAGVKLAQMEGNTVMIVGAVGLAGLGIALAASSSGGGPTTFTSHGNDDNDYRHFSVTRAIFVTRMGGASRLSLFLGSGGESAGGARSRHIGQGCGFTLADGKSLSRPPRPWGEYAGVIATPGRFRHPPRSYP